jgi:Zn-dependent protease
MASTSQGSIRLFRFAGIDLYLHWSWFFVALYEINQRAGRYTSLTWNVLEYLALFGIVLLHEFGHSLACRQVGGHADRIVLWPLGGVAYVQPPQRPGATLWSIAAGPLVNVVLIPVLYLLGTLMRVSGASQAAPDAFRLLQTIAFINVLLLAFNLLPIYPLDGGQILRSLLWFLLGRAWSLTIVTVLGFVGVAGLVLLALWVRSPWLGIMAAFILLNCWNGLRYALRLVRMARAPRREGLACPACRTAPPAGAFWTCSRCGKTFDVFETEAVCPHCGITFAITRCLECGSDSPIGAWNPPAEPRADSTQATF